MRIGTAIAAALFVFVTRLCAPAAQELRIHLDLCSLYSKYNAPAGDNELLKRNYNTELMNNHPDKGGDGLLIPSLRVDKIMFEALKDAQCSISLPQWILALEKYLLAFVCVSAVGVRFLFKNQNRQAMERGPVTPPIAPRVNASQFPICWNGTIGSSFGVELGSRLPTMKPMLCILLLFFVSTVGAKVDEKFFKQIAQRHQNFIKWDNDLPPCAVNGTMCQFTVCKCVDIGYFTRDYYVYHSERNGIHLQTNSYHVNSVPRDSIGFVTDMWWTSTLIDLFWDGPGWDDVIKFLAAYAVKGQVDSKYEAYKLLEAAAIRFAVEGPKYHSEL